MATAATTSGDIPASGFNVSDISTLLGLVAPTGDGTKTVSPSSTTTNTGATSTATNTNQVVGGSQQTQQTGPTSTQVVSQQYVDPAGVTQLVNNILSGSQGLAATATGEKVSGVYNSTTNAMLQDNLIAQTAGQAALLNKTDTTTTTNSGGTNVVTNSGSTNTGSTVQNNSGGTNTTNNSAISTTQQNAAQISGNTAGLIAGAGVANSLLNSATSVGGLINKVIGGSSSGGTNLAPSLTGTSPGTETGPGTGLNSADNAVTHSDSGYSGTSPLEQPYGNEGSSPNPATVGQTPDSVDNDELASLGIDASQLYGDYKAGSAAYDWISSQISSGLAGDAGAAAALGTEFGAGIGNAIAVAGEAAADGGILAGLAGVAEDVGVIAANQPRPSSTTGAVRTAAPNTSTSSGTAQSQAATLMGTSDNVHSAVNWIICTELVVQWRMNRNWHVIGSQVFNSYPEVVKQGYYLWAIPAVHHLRRSPYSSISITLCTIFNWRLENIAACAGKRSARKLIRGALVTMTLYPICYILGTAMKLLGKERNYQDVYN